MFLITRDLLCTEGKKGVQLGVWERAEQEKLYVHSV